MEKQHLKSKHKTANRILINTIIIYAQKFSTAALALVTTPLLLKVLGVEDYGIYNVVGGFVSMFSMVSSSFLLAAVKRRLFNLTMSKTNIASKRR